LKVAWVTDSTVHNTEAINKHPDIYVVPMTILIGDDEYQDGIELTPHELFKTLNSSDKEVKTSQPSIGIFQELYEQLAGSYDRIISIHVSSHFSGTVSSATQAAQLVEIPVDVIDSKILSNPLTELILSGIKWLENGIPMEGVIHQLERKIDRAETYVMVGSLEQLHKSGRMNGLSFFIGSVLKIKPILSIEEGKLSVKEKVRSINKGYSRMKDYFDDALSRRRIHTVSILYGLNKNDALNWIEEFSVKYPGISFTANPLGAVIGVHVGENTLGISWFAEED
jgi:DegV family protein with EDD domain